MGYPMCWSRAVSRNNLGGGYASTFSATQLEQALSLIRGDLRRVENDQRDLDHLEAYAKLAGVRCSQVKTILDAFFGDVDALFAATLKDNRPDTPAPNK